MTMWTQQQADYASGYDRGKVDALDSLPSLESRFTEEWRRGYADGFRRGTAQRRSEHHD